MRKRRHSHQIVEPAQIPEVPQQSYFYVAAVICILSAIGLACIFPVQSDDVFMYLAIGRRFFTEGRLPRIDPFLFSLPNYHWHISHEWLSHLTAYGLFKVGGWTALIFAKTVLIIATASVPIWLARQLGVRSVVTPLVITLAAISGAHRFIERSSLVSDLLTAVVLAICLKERTAPRRLVYFLPLLFLAWANLHPGFYVGLAIFGLALLTRLAQWKDRSTRVMAACFAASVLALFLNPDGPRGVLYPLRPLFDPTWAAYRQSNYEWMPTLAPPFSDSIHAAAFLSLAGIDFLFLLVVLRRGPWFEIIIFALLVWLGLSAARFLSTSAWALAVLAPALRAKISGEIPPLRNAFSRLALMTNVVFAILGLGFCIKVALAGYGTLAGPRRLGFGLDPALHPIAAAEFIEHIDLRTPLFNQHEFGCYLAWRWNGARKLFYHGFVDDLAFYDHDYLAVNRSREEFDRVVGKYSIGAFLLDRVRSPTLAASPPLYQFLLTDPQWRLIHTDAQSMLFLCNTPQNESSLRIAEAKQ